MMAKTARTVLIHAGPDGQFTIPDEFTTALGITEGMLLRVRLEGGELKIAPEHDDESVHGSAWLRELYDYYAPVREEILARGISEEEVNADIDAAITAVRAEKSARRG